MHSCRLDRMFIDSSGVIQYINPSSSCILGINSQYRRQTDWGKRTNATSLKFVHFSRRKFSVDNTASIHFSKLSLATVSIGWNKNFSCKMYDFQTKQREYSMTIIHICIAFGYCWIHTALYIPDVLHSSNTSYLDTQVTTAGSANG